LVRSLYWALSTLVTRDLDAKALQRLDIDAGDGQHLVLPLQQDVEGEGRAFGILQTPSCTVQPASSSSWVALRMPLRLASDPSETGRA
jgi:hypothetical protein